MTPELIEKAKQLGVNPNVCNWFQFFAQETWNRIGYARSRRGHSITETTITQNLIFEFHTSKSLYSSMLPNSWGMEILESVNEIANGNDIELFVETQDGLMFFAIQAKIIYHHTGNNSQLSNGRYRAMNHSNINGNQIELLCNYAAHKGGLPLYLLYNYVNREMESDSKCNIDFGIEQYGCSISNAKKIKEHYFNGERVRTPSFNMLHPDHALPWFVIPCCFASKSKSQILEMLGEEELPADEVRSYTMDEVRYDDSWRNVDPFSDFKKGKILKTNTAEFRPRYRIIISQELSQKNKRGNY